MATVPNLPHESRSSHQLRRDRITAMIVLVVVAGLMALMIWLASLGDGAAEHINEFWPMLP